MERKFFGQPKIDSNSPRMVKFCREFMFSVVFLSLWVVTSTARCVDSLKSVGTSKIVGIRFFPSNSSFGVVDFDSRFTIWDKTGKMVHNEFLNLGTFQDRPIKTNCAVIHPSGSLFLVISDGTTVHYLNGVKSNPTSFGPLYQANPVWAHPNSCGLQIAVNVHFFTADQTVPQMTHSSNFNDFWMNFKILNRISVHGYNGDMFFTYTSKSICPIKLVQVGQLLQPNNSAPSCATQTDASVYSIESSIGSRSDFIVYTRLNRMSLSNYTQEIVLRSRTSGTTTIKEFREFRIYSFAIHPTLNKIFAMSSQGALYSFNFDPALVTLDLAYTEIHPGVNGKYMEMQLIDPTGLLIRSAESLAVYNFTSNTMLVLVERPAYYKPVPALTTGFLVYENKRITLYDPVAHQETQTLLEANVIDVAVSPSTTNQAVCVATKTDIRIYTLPTGALVRTRSIQELQTYSISTVTRIISIDSVTYRTGSPSTIVVSLFAEFTSALDTGSILVMLDEQTLSLSIPAVFYKANPPVHITSIAWGPDPSGGSAEAVFATAPMYTFWLRYSQATGFVELAKNEVTFRYNSDPMDPVSSNYKSVNYHGQKTVFQTGSQTVTAFGSGGQSSIYCAGVTCPSDRQPWIFPYNINSGSAMLETSPSPTTGHVFWGSAYLLRSVDLQNYGRMILMRSESLRQGALYTSMLANGKNALFVTGGSTSLTSLSPDGCYYGNGEPWHEIFALCDVLNCANCNMFDPTKCKECNNPYVVSLDETSCDASCAGGWGFGGKCYNQCPIDTVRSTDASGLCLDVPACGAASKFVQGQFCVATCASGLSPSGSYCVCPPGSKVALATSSNAQCIPSAQDCPSGEVEWSHTGNCINRLHLPSTDFTIVNNSRAYCDPYNFYLEFSTGKCVHSCTVAAPILATTNLGKLCVSAAECTTNLGYFIDSSASPTACLQDCRTNPLRPYVSNSKCLQSCADLGMFVDEKNSSCVSSCNESGQLLNGVCYRSMKFSSMNCTTFSGSSARVDIQTFFQFKTTSELVSELVELEHTLIQSICFTSEPNTEFCILGAQNIGYNITFNSTSGLARLNVSIPSSQYPLDAKKRTSISLLANDSSWMFANKMLSRFAERSSTVCTFVPKNTTVAPVTEDSDWSKTVSTFVKPVTVSIQILTLFLPFAMVTIMDPQVGNMLGFLTRTYSKLVMISYFAFKKLDNNYAKLYYSMFLEILDTMNELVMQPVIGTERIERNKQTVCDTGLSKLCSLTVEENLYFSYTVTFIILLIEFGGTQLLILLSKVCGWREWGDYMRKQSRLVLFPSFILENALEFAFSMMLTAYVTQPVDGVLTAGKICSHITLALWIIFLVGICYADLPIPSTSITGFMSHELPDSGPQGSNSSVSKQTDESQPAGSPSLMSRIRSIWLSYIKLCTAVLKRLSHVFEETVAPEYHFAAVKWSLALDFTLAALVACLQTHPIVQISLWLCVEIGLTLFLTRRKLFRTSLLDKRQRTFSYLLVAIEASMLTSEIIGSEVAGLYTAAAILLLSAAALAIDIGFLGVLCFYMLRRVFASDKQPSATQDKQSVDRDPPLRQSPIISGKVPSPNGMLADSRPKVQLNLFSKSHSKVTAFNSVHKLTKPYTAEVTNELSSTGRLLMASHIKSLGESRIRSTRQRTPNTVWPLIGDSATKPQTLGSPVRSKVVNKMFKRSLRKESAS